MRFCLALFLFLLFPLPVSAGEGVLVFGSMGDAMDAVSLAVLKEAYARLGVVVEGRPLPAARSLIESDKGRLDGELNRIDEIEAAHPTLIRVPVPVNVIDGVVFVCDADFEVKGWGSLEPHSVGYKLGVQIVEIRTRGMTRVQAFSGYDKPFDLLAMGRLDAVLAPRSEGVTQWRRPGKECVRALEPPLESVKLYHYLHKRHADLVPKITAVLSDMQKNGDICRIWRQFNKTDICF